MAETKGITISFYGDTVEFDRSVDGINKALKGTKNELKEVNKSLKFDSSNPEKLQRQFELLTQKQQLLKNSIELYREELAKLGDYNNLTDGQKKQWESLQKSILQAENDLSAVNRQLDVLKTKDIRSIGKQLEEVGNNLNKIGDKIENVGKKFMVLTGAITGLATAGISYNAELEKQTTLFTTLTGSAEKAKEVLKGIKDDALGSPFDTQSLITANQYLIATGMEADESRASIKALGDAISATGGGNSELRRMAQNLQQVKNVGKASSMDVKQFAMAGIDIWGILADSTGKTVEQLQEMDITFDMINEALIKASSEGGRYYGAMSAQAETLNGKISMLKSTFQELLGSLTESLVPIIKQVLDYLQQLINKFQKLNDTQKETIVKIAGIAAAIGPLLTIVGKLIGKKGLGGLITTFSNLLRNDKVVYLFTQIQSAGGGLTGVLSVLKKAVENLFSPWNIVIGLLVMLYTKSESFRTAVNDLVKALVTALKPAFEAVKAVIDLLITVFGTIATLIVNVVDVAFKSLGDILSPLVDVIKSIVEWLGDKLKPVFEAISKLAGTLKTDFGNLKTAIENTGKVFKDQLSVAIQDSVDKIKDIIDWINQLFEKLKNTTFGNAFTTVLNGIGSVLGGITDKVRELTNGLDSSVAKTNTLIARQQVSNSARSSRAVVFDDSLIGSGGFGLQANITINNNGTPVDKNMLDGWAEEIATKVDVVLGRWI